MPADGIALNRFRPVRKLLAASFALFKDMDSDSNMRGNMDNDRVVMIEFALLRCCRLLAAIWPIGA
ncbi:hypothetical protein CSC75_19255 [Pseudoxanthomonas wuyuanensis]|nr:hypothetical protein CSC75_19255 [Pseudoxanthomonas wuyuanensis]